MEVKIDGETQVVDKNRTLVIPPSAEHGFKVVGEDTAELLVFFPAPDTCSTGNTHYLEGARPA